MRLIAATCATSHPERKKAKTSTSSPCLVRTARTTSSPSSLLTWFPAHFESAPPIAPAFPARKPPPPHRAARVTTAPTVRRRSEEHTSELQSLMRISYAVFCLKNTTNNNEDKNLHNSTIIQ